LHPAACSIRLTQVVTYRHQQRAADPLFDNRKVVRQPCSNTIFNQEHNRWTTPFSQYTASAMIC
jgi:hypothetical protein